MALVTRAARPSYDVGSALYATNLPLVAGEALDIFAPCHIESDGLVYMSNATALGADSIIVGFTVRDVLVGEPVTLHGWGLVCQYADGTLTAGAKLWLAATDGRLEDGAATVGDPYGTAVCLDDSNIMFTRNPGGA